MSWLQQKTYWTGRRFCVGFQEHFQNFKKGNGKSKFAHLIDNKYSIVPMEDIMEILHIT